MKIKIDGVSKMNCIRPGSRWTRLNCRRARGLGPHHSRPPAMYCRQTRCCQALQSLARCQVRIKLARAKAAERRFKIREVMVYATMFASDSTRAFNSPYPEACVGASITVTRMVLIGLRVLQEVSCGLAMKTTSAYPRSRQGSAGDPF